MRAALLVLLLFGLAQDAFAQRVVLSPELSLLLNRERPSDLGNQDLQGAAIDDAVLGVIVYTTDPSRIEAVGGRVESRYPQFVTARLTVEQITALTQVPEIQGIEYSFSYPMNDGAAALVGARALNQGLLRGSSYTGAGVLACVIDTGIDPFHRDFRHGAATLSSRIYRIWDQFLGNSVGDPLRIGDGETRPAGFSYGVEFTRDHIEAELRGETTGFVRTNDPNGHGTHVAGTIASTGFALQGRHRGMAPEADLVIIRAGYPFSNAGIIDGITYCHNVATAAGKPAVLNISLASDFGPHDGSDALSVAASEFGRNIGRIVVLSAGNSGAKNLHKQTDVIAQQSGFFELAVPMYSAQAGLDNDGVRLDTWLDSNLPVRVEVTTPNGITVTQNPQGQSEHATADGFVYLYNFIAPGSDSLTSHRRIYLDIYDKVDNSITRNPASGTWRITLINQDPDRAFTAHSWMAPRGGLASTTLVGGDSEYTVGYAAEDAIIVGAYWHRPLWQSQDDTLRVDGNTVFEISTTSSRGPSRDGRTMPHLAAPGEYIISAKPSAPVSSNRFFAPGGVHFLQGGTSVSAPVVAGSAALLLQQDSTLTTPQARTLLQETAFGDALTSTLPNNRFGAGRLDVYSAMARLVDDQRPMRMERVYYTTSLPNATSTFATSVAVGMRTTHPFSGAGFVRGMSLHLGGTVPAAGTPVVFRAYLSNSGTPGALVGAVSVPMPAQTGGTWTYLDFGSEPIALQGGREYILTAHTTSGSLSVHHDNTSGNTRFGTWNTTTQAWTSAGTQYAIIAYFSEDAAVPLQNIAYTQNFSGFTSTLPEGWMASAGAASSTYGGMWGAETSAGLRGGANVLGFQHTAETDVFRTTLTLQNTTGQTVEALKVRFQGRTSRTDAPHTPSWTVTVNGTPVDALTYDTALGFDVPVTAIATGLSIPHNAYVAIEWASSRDENVEVDSRQIGVGEVSVEWVYAVPLQQAERFALLASPVQTTYASLLSTTWTQGAANANTPLGGANVWRWNAASQAWAAVDSLSRAIPAGNGFLTYLFPRAHFDVPSSTHFPRAIGAYGAGHALPLTLEATTVANGYMLYGNPSRETLSWNALGRTNLSEIVSVLDAQTGQYHTFNGTTGELTGGLIAPFQGFFVTAVDSGDTSLNITEDALTTGGVFRGKTDEDVFEARIAVSGEGLRAATWFSFLEDASLNADAFDAPFLQPLASSYVRWASVRPDGALQSIQSLPTALPHPADVPLLLESTRDGTYVLEATRVHLPHGMQATLLDTHTGESLPFVEGMRHSVRLTARPSGKTEATAPDLLVAETLSAEAQPRFVVRFEGGMATSAPRDAWTFRLDAVFPNPVHARGTLRFALAAPSTARLTVYDLLGRHIATLADGNHPAGTHELSINTAGWPTGVYVVRLQAGERAQTKRFSVVR